MSSDMLYKYLNANKQTSLKEKAGIRQAGRVHILMLSFLDHIKLIGHATAIGDARFESQPTNQTIEDGAFARARVPNQQEVGTAGACNVAGHVKCRRAGQKQCQGHLAATGAIEIIILVDGQATQHTTGGW